MALFDIIFEAAVLVMFLLFIVVSISIISSRKKRQVNEQEVNPILGQVFNNSMRISNSQLRQENIIYPRTDPAQFELQFEYDQNEIYHMNRDEMVKEYFQTRKRYTVINPQKQSNLRRVSSYY